MAMASNVLPQRMRVYQNHHLDSTRWDSYEPRADDVIISTSVKAGTTWMQRIVSLLVFGCGELPTSLWEISPWLDNRFFPIDHVIGSLAAQEHTRFIKSHLPLDALPYHGGVRYIAVGRDTRDVAMSLFNHYRSYTDLAHQVLDQFGGMPRCPDDVREFWREYMTKGTVPWETDGSPYWSHHYHAASFWRFRDLDNVLLVHYKDLKADLEANMRRVADFTGLEQSEDDWPALVHAATFETMKAEAKTLLPETEFMFGSTDNFIYKGTNERWRDALTSDDLELYERAAEKLDPALRHWLEHGGVVPTGRTAPGSRTAPRTVRRAP